MIDILRFTITGAAAGVVLAMLAFGVNVIYRASRVINFSHAAIALTAAYLYKVFLGFAPTPVAVILAIVVGMAIGTVIDQLVMRFLRSASALTKAMATIGVLLTLQSIINIIFGYNPIIVPPFLPTNVVSIFGADVGLDRIIMIAIGVVATAVLWAIYKFSSFGIATTALSVNERSLAALGKWSPRRVSLINWMLAGGLAAFAGVLLAPVTSLSPDLALVLIVPILSTGLLGNLWSFWLTLLGGVVIGVAQAQISRFSEVPGLTEAIPFLVIAILLAARGSSLPQRGETAEVLPRIASGRIPWIPVIVATIVLLSVVLFVPIGSKWVASIIVAVVTAVVLLSLVVVTGYAGQLSLASYGLAGVAALVSAHLVASVGWPFLPAAIVGILATIPIGLIVGLPAVRTRGTSLAIVTLGLAVALQALVFNNPLITGRSLDVGRPEIFGIDITPRGATASHYAAFAIIVLALVGIAVLNLRRSNAGRRMVAVRGNERAAASIGISVARTKLYAFVVSGLIAGIGGVLIAFTQQYVGLGNPGGRFDPSFSINAIAQTTVGGIGFVSGSFVGSAMVPGAVMNQIMSFIAQGSWFNLIGGVLLLLTVVTAPSGVAANMARDFSNLWRKIRRGRIKEQPLPVLGDASATRVEPATLVVADLNVAFGGNRVLQDVSVTVRPGEVLGIIGPNGAGKTTLVDAITGYNHPQSGRILIDGRDVSRLAPAARAQAGIGRSFQALEIFEDLSVLDNLLVASEGANLWRTVFAGVVPGKPRLTPAATAAVQSFGLADRLRDAPGDLSYGERRLLAIARSLASSPRVLLLDEPAAGLGIDERSELRKLVRSLADDWGIAVLLIEHDVELVMSVSDQVVALDFGKVIAQGEPETVRNDAAVIAAYLGTDEPVDGVEEPIREGQPA